MSVKAKKEFQDFIKKSSFTFIVRFFLLFISLISSIVIARKLGPHGQGLYATALALCSIAAQLGNIGLQSANTFFSSKDAYLLKSLLYNSIFTSLLASSFFIVIAYILYNFFPSIWPINKELTVISSFWLPAGLTLLLTQGLLVGIQQIFKYNVIEFTQKITFFLIICLIFYVDNISPKTFFLFNTLSVYVAAALCIYFIKRYPSFVRKYTFDSSFYFKTIRYSMGAYVASILSYLTLRFDLLMVKTMTSSQSTGNYSIAVSIADVLYMLPSVVGLMLFSKLSPDSVSEHRVHILKKSISLLSIIMLFFSIIAALTAHFFIDLFYGKEFNTAAQALIYLIPGIYFLSLSTQNQNFMASTKRLKMMTIGPFLAFIINILLNLLLIPSLGINGAAISSSISYTLWFAVSSILLYSSIKKSNEAT